MDSAEIENLQQELYSARKEIQLLNANNEHLTSENSDLHQELSSLGEKNDGERVRLKSSNDLCQMGENKILDLTERLQLSEKEKELAEAKIDEFEKTIACLEAKLKSDLPPACNCKSEEEVLRERLEFMERELEMKKEDLAEAGVSLQRAMEKNINYKGEMEELSEEMECLQSQINSQYNVIQSQREELQGMRCQAEVESMATDTNRKGNSLFSEVEDRRVIAETKMVKLVEKANKLETSLKNEKKETRRLKNQVSLLLRSSGRADEKTVQSLEYELEKSKKQVMSLTQQLANKQETATKLPIDAAVLNRNSTDNPLTAYYKDTIKLLQKEKEGLVKEKKQQEFQVSHLDCNLTQKKNEVRRLLSEKERLSTLIAHQTIVIESLKQESESNEDIQSSGETMAIPSQSSKNNTVDKHVFSSSSDSSIKPEPASDPDQTKSSSKSTKGNAAAGSSDPWSSLLQTKSKSKSVTFSSSSKCEDSNSSPAARSSSTKHVLSDSTSTSSSKENRLVDIDIDRLLDDEDNMNKGGEKSAAFKSSKSTKSGKSLTQGGGYGKYSSVSYSKMSDVEQAEAKPECNQQ